MAKNKKADLTKNLNLGNVKSFNNASTEKEKRKTMVISVQGEYVNKFIGIAFSYYESIGQLKDYSYAGFLPIALERVEKLFLKKYGKLEEPSNDMLLFYKSKSKGKEAGLEKYYPIGNEGFQRINFNVLESDSYTYYKLMHNFFKNERKGLFTFSISLFFYDLVRILEEEGI